MASTFPSASGGSSGNPMMATLSRLTPVQKIALGAAALTLVAGTVVLSRSGPGADMTAVYTDLEPRDAAAVTDELIDRGVEYELVDGGRTVLVPREQVYDLRVNLSAEGLPSSSEGYALLDRQGITTSEFRQRIDFQRALEGELSATLESIDGVEDATVHLALPEESVFVDEPTAPTASVLVRHGGAGAISNEQVAAMVHLVASSVKGMTPENVTVADATGAVLSAGGEPGAAITAGGTRTDASAAVERDVANSLRSMIGRVAGFENVAVSVRADLDLTERQATTESFDTSAEGDATGVVVSERLATESYSGLDQEGVTGVLGPDGAPVEASPAESENSYSKDDAERTYAVNRTVESTTEQTGEVTRLNVAVLVDEASVTEEQRVAIETMVGTAAGVDLERGDQVVVTRLPFDDSATEAATEAAEIEAAEAAAAERSGLIRTGVIAGMILIAMLLAYRSSRRARREVATPIDIGAIRAAQVVEPEPSAAIAPPTPAPVNPVNQASREALDELSGLADRRPEEVAQILQSWLTEDAS